MEDLEQTDTTNLVPAGRGKAAFRYDAGSRKPPTYPLETSSFSPGTEARMEAQQAVKSNQVGDGTGSGGTDD